MNDHFFPRPPATLDAIDMETRALGFSMASEPKTGALLSSLAATKPGGRFLELGTGTGMGTSWLLAGMDARSHLDSVDNDPSAQAVARRHLGHDTRVSFHLEDGADYIGRVRKERFDVIYADTWAGKFTHLDETLSLVSAGGIYFIDDLLPQPNWPDGHAPKVEALIDRLERLQGFSVVRLAWASGLMLAVRGGAA